MILIINLVYPAVAYSGESKADELQITGVSADPFAFNPSKQQSVKVRFHLNQPANVTLNIYDARDKLIRQIASKGMLASDDNRLLWDGKDRNGRTVVPEAYHYTLEAKDKSGKTVVHDLSDITGGETVPINDLMYDSKKEELSYSLSAPARIYIRGGWRITQ